MIFEMRFQILALAASLTASTLAGYALAVPPTASPANMDRFAAISDASRWSATIFTEFGNEMAWEDKAWEDKAWEDRIRKDNTPADNCAPLRGNARNGNRLLEGLVRRISQGGSKGWTGAPGKAACRAP
jgi:hypothetical protein